MASWRPSSTEISTGAGDNPGSQWRDYLMSHSFAWKGHRMPVWPASSSVADPVLDVPSLYAAHWRSMVRLAVLLVDDLPSAEDAVQEAFVSLYRHQDRLRDPQAALGYVRQAIVNRCRSDLRHRRVVRGSLSRFVGSAAVEEGEQRARFEAVGLDSEMLAAVRALPARTQQVLVLRYYADLSEAQIAQTLGISTGTVKSLAHRGIATLRRELGGVS